MFLVCVLHPFGLSVCLHANQRARIKQAAQLTLELIWGYSYLQATNDRAGFQKQQLEVRGGNTDTQTRRQTGDDETPPMYL